MTNGLFHNLLTILDEDAVLLGSIGNADARERVDSIVSRLLLHLNAIDARRNLHTCSSLVSCLLDGHHRHFTRTVEDNDIGVTVGQRLDLEDVTRIARAVVDAEVLVACTSLDLIGTQAQLTVPALSSAIELEALAATISCTQLLAVGQRQRVDFVSHLSQAYRLVE